VKGLDELLKRRIELKIDGRTPEMRRLKPWMRRLR
jgi:hypothetical protein